MKLLIPLWDTETDQPMGDVFGVVRLNQKLARMLLAKKLLMELAGSLYTKFFKMEFEERSLKVASGLRGEDFQYAAERALAEGSVVRIPDLPAVGTTEFAVAHSVLIMTQHEWKWRLRVEWDGQNRVMETCDLQWEDVLKAAGEDFDPRASISDGTNWEE